MNRPLPDPRQPLDAQAATDAFDRIMDGLADEDAITDFLATLADRGETAAEVAIAALALRQRMVGIHAPVGAIDVCGTGGDGQHTLNISTAVAFVVAGAGVPIAKHGNRAMSSQSGAADVLAALGWTPELSLDRLEALLAEVGIVFLHAQRHHPAMARVAPIRRRLARRTIFNLLGPLANPAAVHRQMIGVPSPVFAALVAQAGALLGAEQILAVHGSGLDEIAVHGPSELVWSTGECETFHPAAHGIALYPREAIRGGTPAENATTLRQLLAGSGPPAYRDIVVANAGAALLAAGVEADWGAAFARATASLDSGAAADRLARFLAFR